VASCAIFKRSLKAIGILFLLFGMFSLGSVDAQEPGTETLVSVTTPGIAQYSPAISGNGIVWADGLNGYLHFYNVVSGNETVIQNSTYFYETPAISGDKIVSQAFSSNYDIFLYDITTGQKIIINPDSDNSEDIAPSISEQYVTWKSYSYDDGTCNVMLYDLDNPMNSPETIATNTASCGCVIGDLNCLDPQVYPSPSVSGSYIVWDAYVNSQYDIFLYNISDHTILNITEDALDSDQEYPVISGNYISWMDNRNGNWDIYLANISNLSDIRISPITTETSSQVFPAIDSTKVVWRDEGTESIYLFDAVTDSSVRITSPMRQPYDPAISANRIVYTGDAPDPQIYLFTYDVFVECPLANFIATPNSAATAPLTVQFNDTSDPSPIITIWNFGDGSQVSYAMNPAHIYTSTGTYDLSLIVSTPYCRSMIVKNDFVSIGAKPITNFTGAPTCGVMPLSVSFSDRSTGTPTGWAWDFNNDGITDSMVQNPIFIYHEGGTYSVNLTTSNAMGEESLLKTYYISVMNRSGTVVNTTLEGLTIIDTVHLILNTTKIPDYSLNSNILTLTPPPENQIKEIILIADNTGFTANGDTIEGNLTRVFLTSASIPMEGFSEEIGPEAYVNFTLEMPGYPVDGLVTPYLFENAVPCDEHDLDKISYDSGFSELSRTAYEVRLLKQNIGTVSNMSLYLSVNSSWVTDRSKVWVIRIGDDGTGEVLPTQFFGEDTVHNLDIFSAYSPRGPSRFALTILSQAGNPLQIIVLIVLYLGKGRIYLFVM
jgi:beta propeller repeat protein